METDFTESVSQEKDTDINKSTNKADTRRIFQVTKPEFTEADLHIHGPLTYEHSGKYLELFYNIILGHDGLELPDHLRPVALALGDSSITNLMVIISPGAGKSVLMDEIFPIWEMGLNNSTTVLGVSAAEGLMKQFLQTSMSIISDNKVYKEIYPKTIPDFDAGWSVTGGMYLQRSESGLASASYSVYGAGSKKLIGKHAKILIADDIHDEMNSSSNTSVDGLEEWYYRTWVGRGDPTGYRMIMIGRRWAENDLYGRQKKSDDWLVMELAAIRDESKELYYDVRIPKGLKCVFNDFKAHPYKEDIKVVYGHDERGFYWPFKDEDPPEAPGKSKYREASVIRRNKPDIFETVYQCKPEAAGYKIFRKDDFLYYKAPENLVNGRAYPDVIELLENCEIILESWDTAFSASSTSDPSCCYAAGLYPCRKSHRRHSGDLEDEDIPFHYDIYVLDELHKKMDFGDLTDEAHAFYEKWIPYKVLVEKSALGHPLIKDLHKYNVPVDGITVQATTKKSRAINGAKAGSAQGWFRLGRVFFPFIPNDEGNNGIPWVEALENELQDFTGGNHETDDRVDSLIQLINWAIDLGVEARDLPDGWQTPEQVDQHIRAWSKQPNPYEPIVTMMTRSIDPFDGYCARCLNFEEDRSWCKLHKQRTSSLHSCAAYNPKEKNSRQLVLRVI